MKSIYDSNQSRCNKPKGRSGQVNNSSKLSLWAGKKKKNTLLVDLDPQSHSSCIYKYHIEKEDTVSNLFLSKDFNINKIITPAMVKSGTVDKLDIIPSSIHLALVAEQIISTTYRESLLDKHFQKIINDYDYIIEDCPPTLGVITVNAIYTADIILIPTNYGRYSLDGIADLFNSIKEIKDGSSYKYWIIRNLFEKRNNQTNVYVEDQLSTFKEHMFNTIIRKNEAINQSQINGEPVFLFNPNCSGTSDFTQLVEEFLINVEN